jgi:predicted SprT family Zn-dependent metalloprotease
MRVLRFLKMIVAHELAHLKEREHDKARILQNSSTV